MAYYKPGYMFKVTNTETITDYNDACPKDVVIAETLNRDTVIEICYRAFIC